MILRFMMFLFLGFLIMSSISCREVNNYSYEYVSLELLDGVIEINLVGQYGENYENDGKKLLDYGFPYNLQFTYAVPPTFPLCSVEIKNITLTGKKTGKSYSLDELFSQKVRTYKTRRLVRMSAGPLESNKFTYEDFLLEANLIIEKNENSMRTEKISVLLKTNYKKEIRNAWFDKKTGV